MSVTAWFLHCVAGCSLICAAFLQVSENPGLFIICDANGIVMNFVYWGPMMVVTSCTTGMRLKSKSSGIVLRFGVCVALAGGGMP